MRTDRYSLAAGCAGLAAMLTACARSAGYGGGGDFGYVDHTKLFFLQLLTYGFSAGIGFAIGYGFSEKNAGVRRRVVQLALVAALILSLILPDRYLAVRGLLATLCTVILFFVALAFGFALGKLPEMGGPGSPTNTTTYGSAKWMTLLKLSASPLGLIGMDGLVLGYFRDGRTPLQYKGDRHLLTVAPTRAGKGVSAIIPNLLSYTGSALVNDPKGELAKITAVRRGQGNGKIPGLGHDVHVVDPWGITGLPSAHFNPLDWLADPANPEIGENALMLADALIPPAGNAKDSFWDEEAKGLLMGLLLHVATSPDEAGNRTLGRVRDLLQLGPDEFDALCITMSENVNSTVAGTGRRTAGKSENLLSSVLAVAQSHTHFLDSPGLRDSLSRSDFRFEDMKTRPVTVYLVLPADRLHTFGRWLRLLIQQAITVTARNVEAQPEKPILFMLDEMAALGRLSMVQQAYGLMAGFGMQMWGIVQDFSQLNDVYGSGWQTFIANSGVVQYFGSLDKETKDYLSDMCGSQTIATLSSTIGKTLGMGVGASGSESTSHSHGETSRKLIMPDELGRLKTGAQLLLVENEDPIDGRKLVWFQDERFRSLGINLKKRAA